MNYVLVHRGNNRWRKHARKLNEFSNMELFLGYHKRHSCEKECKEILLTIYKKNEVYEMYKP